MPRTLFVTPDYASAEYQCRTLRTPNNLEMLGVFNKALLLMLDPYNWEQINDTDLTVDETITLVTSILAEFWATETCGDGGGCMLPGLDTPPFRLGVDGRFEMLDPETGEWGAPSGEYEIPPTPPREESTSFDRRCAAAANAANVMKQLYEAITDEISLGGDALQVAAAMVAALVTAVGGWIAAPVYAIIQLTIALFVGMIELLQVLGGDVWTTEFDNRLKCALLACATSTGDVVTFDLACIREQLNQPPDLLNPTWFYELQLFAQVLYLMEVITMDGLNAAGATTGIADANCDDCEGWCWTIDFTETDGEFHHIDAGTGDWTSGVGWVGTVEDATVRVRIERTFGFDAQFTGMTIVYDLVYGDGSPAGAAYLVKDGVTEVHTTGLPAGADQTASWFGEFIADYCTIQIRTGTINSNGALTVKRITYTGNGENPFGENNCE